MVCSYLLIRWVVLPITGMQVEVSILSRKTVSHGMLKDTAVDERHCEVGAMRK